MNHIATPARPFAIVGIIVPLMAFAALALALIYLTGNYAWDDGAITLAYSRTLGEHGRFALTPVSEVVEGSSSLLFTALMAGVQALLHLDFDQLVRASQCATLGFWMTVLVVMDRVLHPILPDWTSRTLALGILAVLPMPLTEMLNGMEMTLFALLLLAVVIAYERRSAWLWVAVPLVMLVRFEAVFYLCFATGSIVVFDAKHRAQALKVMAWSLILFVVFTAWRWSYFGDVLPNTIRAKMQAPYTPPEHGLVLLQTKLEGLFEFVKVNAVWLLILGAGMFATRRTAPILARLASWDFKVWLILSFGVFSALSGVNWGYEGRMCLACLPLLVWVVVERIDAGQAWGGRSMGPKLLIWALVATLLVNASVVAGLAKTLVRGGFYQGLLPSVLSDKLAQKIERARGESWRGELGTTPQNYRVTGEAADRVRQSLGLPVVAVMTPDVGGLGLCCDKIRVLDSGLLTSASLARTGYAGLAAYMEAEKPDLLVTHSFWTTSANLYEQKPFVDHYVPVVVDRNLFWLRREHLAAMRASPMWSVTPIDNVDALAQFRYGGRAVDMDYIRQHFQVPIWRFDRAGKGI